MGGVGGRGGRCGNKNKQIACQVSQAACIFMCDCMIARFLSLSRISIISGRVEREMLVSRQGRQGRLLYEAGVGS